MKPFDENKVDNDVSTLLFSFWDRNLEILAFFASVSD